MNEEVGLGPFFFARLKSRLDTLGDGKPGRVTRKGVASWPYTPRPGSACHQNDVPHGGPYPLVSRILF